MAWSEGSLAARVGTDSLRIIPLLFFILSGCSQKLPPNSSRSAVNTFDHTGIQASACMECHGTPTPHVPVPTSCDRCHESVRPSQTMLPPPAAPVTGHFGTTECKQCHLPLLAPGQIFAFTHQQASGAPVATCSLCHEANRPAPTHNTGQDCVKCHIPGIPWASSGSPHPASNGALSSCLACHESWRPTQTTYPPPGATIAGHFAAQDCNLCHEPKNPPGVIAFTFKHGANGNPNTSCLPCHSAKRPTALVNRFLHNTTASAAGMGDCINCHGNPANLGVTWAGGLFNHLPTPSSCAACHLSNRPPLNTSYPSVPGVGTFTHGRGEHENYDCKTCHTNVGVSWVIAQAPTCAKCH